MKQKVIFLGRDGVITVEKGEVTSKEQLEIFPYVKECITRVHNLGYLAIVITNQPIVGRRMIKEEALREMNEYLKQQTGIDKVFYCPHTKRCECKKPQIGLIMQAEEEWDINRKESYMVGDRKCDILTGINAGIRTVLVDSVYGFKELEKGIIPDYCFETLLDFVQYLQEKEQIV